MFTNFETYTSTAELSSLAISVSIGKARQQYQTDPNGIPMAGTGSLQFQFVSAGGGGKGSIRPASSQSWRGLTKGSILTLWENYVDPQKPSAGGFAFGMYCLANQADMTSGSGRCYAMAFHSSGQTIQILKFSSGVTASNTTQSGVSVLASFTGQSAWPQNSINAAALQWRVSGSTVTLQAKMGFSTSLYSLSTILSAVDSTSAFVSTVGEGMWTHSITNQWAQIYWDSTRFASIP